MEQINMPAGAYYVGDPCLIIKGTPGYHWIEKLWSLFYKLDQRAALLEVDGVKIFIGQTYGGDGIYDGITVDTGTIAVIPVDNLSGDERFNFDNFAIRGTKFFTAPESFVITYDKGDFQIGGHLTVKTRF